VSDALAPQVACLRFDYGDWDAGEGETTDAVNALSWAADRFEGVGLFGYSFGGGVALRAAADASPAVCSVLAPPGDAAGAVDSVACPLQIVVGERDTTVDWAPVADRAAALGHAVERLPATHQFRREPEDVGRIAGQFLTARL